MCWAFGFVNSAGWDRDMAIESGAVLTGQANTEPFQLRIAAECDAAMHTQITDRTQPDPFRRYAILDPLRGLAALWVFLYHYKFSPSFQSHVPQLHAWLKIGDMAVPMFFAISGFCLTLAVRKPTRDGKQRSATEFLKNRIRRIYPTFWASIAFILVLRLITTLIVSPKFAPTWPEYSTAQWFGVATLLQHFTSDGLWFARFSKINGVYWTLAVEFQCYLVMAVAMWFPRYFYRIVACLVFACLPFALSMPHFLMSAQWGSCIPYWPWFASGVGAFWLLEKGVHPQRIFSRYAMPAAVTYLAIVSGLLLLMALTDPTIRNHMAVRLLFACVTAVGIWVVSDADANARNNSVTKTSRSSRWSTQPSLLLLGTMSYSLYLVHDELSRNLQQILRSQGIGIGIVVDLLIVATTLTAAYGFYRVCERPVLQLWKRPTTNQQQRTVESQSILTSKPVAGTEDRRAA